MAGSWGRSSLEAVNLLTILGKQSTELRLWIECDAVYVRKHLPIKLHDAPSRKRINLTFTPARTSNPKYRATYELARNIGHTGVNKVNESLKICLIPSRPIIQRKYSPSHLHLAPRLRTNVAILLRHLMCLYGMERKNFIFACSYWMILRKREDSWSCSRKNSIALSGEFALEETTKPSHDGLRE
jgi:hypothetical protein